MNILLLVLGILLVLVALVDAIWTTLWIDGGAGPVARGSMQATRRAFGAMFGRERPKLRSLAAPFVLVNTFAVWVLLLWFGWWMLFLSDPAAIVRPDTGEPAGAAARFYYTSYTIFTMGNGDYSPQGPVWQVATALATGCGIGLVTLAITYLLSVLSALVAQRSLASLVLGFGHNPADFVRRLRGRGDWAGFDVLAVNLATRIGDVAERHLAYPILHDLVSSRPEKSVEVAIAVLDESMRVIEAGVAEDARPPPFLTDAIRIGIGNYVTLMERTMGLDEGEAPPAPDLAPLREAGVPLASPEAFEARLRDDDARRRKLLALLRSNGWAWRDAS